MIISTLRSTVPRTSQVRLSVQWSGAIVRPTRPETAHQAIRADKLRGWTTRQPDQHVGNVHFVRCRRFMRRSAFLKRRISCSFCVGAGWASNRYGNGQ